MHMLSKAESILLWSNAVWMLGWGMLGPLYAIFAKEIGGSVMELTWVYAIFMIVTGIGTLIVGRYADHVGLERLLVVGFGLTSLATYGYLAVDSILGLLAVQVLWGIATAISEPAWYALYDKHSGDGRRDGFVWSLSSGYSYVLRGVGMLLGGYLVAVYSFDTLFIVMGTVLALSTLYQARILRYRVQ
jgi:MFS family permease